MYIDSHCHVLKSEYNNPIKVINAAKEKGVNKIIINGYDLDSSIEAVEIAEKQDGVYAAIGIGPENIEGFNDEIYLKLKKLLQSKKVVAIGEIGLDYYWTKDNKEEQIIVFKKMLDLAKENNLPVIVHSREAMEDTYNLLSSYKVKGIMHCFSGSYEMAKKFINIGFLIGIGGIVTFKNAKKIKGIVSKISISDISLETDSPYLSPEPYRGKINTPSNIPLIAEEISKIKEISTAVVKAKTEENIYRIFTLITG